MVSPLAETFAYQYLKLVFPGSDNFIFLNTWEEVYYAKSVN